MKFKVEFSNDELNELISDASINPLDAYEAYFEFESDTIPEAFMYALERKEIADHKFKALGASLEDVQNHGLDYPRRVYLLD